jgi:hypothetical protein
MKRMRNRLLFLLGAVLALSSVAAGQPEHRANGFYLTSPLSLSSGYDDNFLVNSRALDDTVSILTAPTLSWMKTTHRTAFSVDYEPEFEIFARHPGLNAWNHSSILRFDHRLSSRLTVDAGDSFLSTDDASRRLADSQFLLPRGRFQQNSFFAGLKYRLDQRTKLFFRFDNAITTMALSGPQANRFDQMTNAGTVTLDHTVNRHHAVTGSYAYLHVRPLDKGGSAGYSYQAVHSLNGGYMYTVNPGLLLRVAGGVVRGREFAYTAGGAVEKQLGGLWMMAGYQRYLSFFGGLTPSGGAPGGTVPFANGLLPNSLFQAVSVRVRGKLTKRVGLEFNGQRGRATFGERGVRSLIAQSRLDYRLSERLIVFARAEYYGQNVSQFSDSPLSRRRYFGGLEIVLSRPPEPEDAPGRRGRIPAASAEPPAEEPRAPEER